MSSSFARNIRTYRAGGVIRAFRFVKFDTDLDSVVECGANERSIGVSNTAATAEGQQVEVAMPGGGAMLKVSEAVGKGKMVTSIAAGIGEVADAAAEWVGAIAYEDGVLDDEIEVMVTGFQAVGSDA